MVVGVPFWPPEAFLTPTTTHRIPFVEAKTRSNVDLVFDDRPTFDAGIMNNHLPTNVGGEFVTLIQRHALRCVVDR